MANDSCVRCGLRFNQAQPQDNPLCVPCGILGCDGLEALLNSVHSHFFTPEEAARAIQAKTKDMVKVSESLRQVVMPGNYGYYEQLEGYALAVSFQKKEELQEYIREIERKNRAASGPQSHR